MTLIKTTFLSFIATAVKMIAALVINKAIATYIGPVGLAMVGQFQNFMQLVSTLAEGAINKGVTKYVSEYGKDSEKTSILLSTASKITLGSSLFTGLCIVLFSHFASIHFLKSEHYRYIFLIYGFTIIFMAINHLLLSIINGFKDVRTWVLINIAQSIYSLIFTTLLIVYLSLDGALLAMVLNQSIILFVVLWMIRRDKIIIKSFLKRDFNVEEAKKLFGFSLMTITSAIALPVTHILIRNYIGENFGWKEAGYWQAIWYISTMYLMVINTALGIYYLPRLSEIQGKAELRKELFYGYKVIMPVVIVVSILIYILKDFIVEVLFSKEFYPMLQLLLWQLIGNAVKMASYLLSFIMVAKAMVKVFIVTEIVSNVSLFLLSMFFLNKFGFVGVSYAFAANYFLYFFMMAYVTKEEW